MKTFLTPPTTKTDVVVPQHEKTFFQASHKTNSAHLPNHVKAPDENEKLQRKEKDTEQPTAPTSSIITAAIDGADEPLEKNTQATMAKKFGYNFSNVRINNSVEGTKAAEALDALAFTAGNKIVFNQSQYLPHTENGKRLIAHELTHVVQQNHSTQHHIQRQVRPGRMPGPHQPSLVPINPSYDDTTPMPPLANRTTQQDVNNYRQAVIDYALEPLNPQTRDYTRLMSILQVYSESGGERLVILKESAAFINRMEQVLNPMTLLYSYSIIEYAGRPPQPYSTLHNAIQSHNGQLTTDLVSIIVSDVNRTTEYINYLRNAIATELNGNAQQESLRLIDNRNQRGNTQSINSNYREVHYETVNGIRQLQQLNGGMNLNCYFTGNELRVIVRIFFIERIDGSQFIPFDLSQHQAIINQWLSAIDRTWNNHFVISNGTNHYNLVFVPTIINNYQSGTNLVYIKTEANQTCQGAAMTPGRANQSCWYLRDPTDVIAHEFGHMLGASDEYNLPATSQEVTQANISLTAEEMELSTVEGINNIENRMRTPGQPPIHRTEFQSDSLMGNNSPTAPVHARHLLRLTNRINENLPQGTSAFTVARR